jgi:chromosome segregation ATPase
LLGKELDLLQLDFEFEDAILEAEKLGADIALVEQLYGLRRLDIIRQYNEEIVSAIESSRDSIADAILNIRREMESFNEIEFQENRIADLWDQFYGGFEGAKDAADIAAKAYADALATNLEIETKKSGLEDTLNAYQEELTEKLSLKDINVENIQINQDALESITETIAYYRKAIEDTQFEIDKIKAEQEFDIFDSIFSAFGVTTENTAALAQLETNLATLESELADSLQQKVDLEKEFGELGDFGKALDSMISTLENNVDAARKELGSYNIQLIDDPQALLYDSQINIAEQIDIVNDLQDAIIDKYNAELQLVQEVENFVIDIQGYLKDLAFSDVSPLTSMERFTQAQSNFEDNLVNLFSEDESIAAIARDRLLASATTLLDEARKYSCNC